MPQAIVGVAASVAGAVAASAIESVVVGAIVGGVVTAGINMLGAELFGPDEPKISTAAKRRALSVNASSNVEPVPIIYGTVRRAGARVLAHATGTDNANLYLVYALCEGGHYASPGTDMVASISDYRFDTITVSDSRFAGLYTITAHGGNDNQAADAALVSEIADSSVWGTTDRLRGVAYLAVKLVMPEPDANGEIPWTGLPQITCMIDGRKVYDPRDPGQSIIDPATWLFSSNPALCILDYLLDTRYGKGLASGEVDLASFMDAADYCDDLVSTPDGGTQRRYACNGMVDPSVPLLNNLDQLLTSCRGFLVWSAGTYKLLLDKEDPVYAFDAVEGTIIGEWAVSLGSRARRYNRVKGHFINPSKEWQPDETVIDSPTFRAEDHSDPLELDLDLPFCTDVYQAQRLSTVALKVSRNQITVQFLATNEILAAETGQLITITHTTPGWVQKPFRVIGMELLPDSNVRVTCVEYNGSAYDAGTLTLAPSPGQTTLPNPFRVLAPTNLVVSSLTAVVADDGTIVARIKADWDAALDRFVDHYEVQWQRSGDTAWANAVTSAAITEYVIAPVTPGVSYTVRVRAVNSLGARSAWLTNSGTPDGKLAAPGAPSALVAATKVEAVALTWTNPADDDFDLIEIWASAGAFGAGALVGTVRGSAFMHSLAAGQTRQYWIRALDTSGNASGWHPSDAGAGVSGTSGAVDTSTVFNILRRIDSTAWRYTFDVEQWAREPWSNSSGTVVSTGADFYLGDAAGLFDAAGAPTDPTGYFVIPNEIVGAWAGKRLRVTFWYKQPGASPSTSARFGFYDHVGATYSASVDVTPTGAWQQKDFILTIPANARGGLVYIAADLVAGANAVLVDTISIDMVPDVLTSANLGTWMANAAIGAAFIANAAIGNAHIQDAAVDTLKIAGNSVTVPDAVYNPGSVLIGSFGGGGAYVAIQQIVHNNIDGWPMLVQWAFDSTINRQVGSVEDYYLDLNGSAAFGAVGLPLLAYAQVAQMVKLSPGAGNHVLTLYARVTLNSAVGNSYANHVAMQCLGVRR